MHNCFLKKCAPLGKKKSKSNKIFIWLIYSFDWHIHCTYLLTDMMFQLMDNCFLMKTCKKYQNSSKKEISTKISTSPQTIFYLSYFKLSYFKLGYTCLMNAEHAPAPPLTCHLACLPSCWFPFFPELHVHFQVMCKRDFLKLYTV